MPTVHLLIKGEVQGVFYRATAKEMADKFDVTGWIKNTKEGFVEVMVTGREKAVQQFTEWCKQGPRRAVVTDVIVTQKEETAFNDFAVIR